MKPQRVVEEGSLRIEIYGGYGEIGGNCVVIRDGDRKLVFDNGVRFSVLRRYYRGRIQPLGTSELRDVRAIPPLSVFEDASAVYISHFHLDHLGLLGALPPETKVYVPSLGVLQTIEEWYRASPTWLAALPHRPYAEVTGVEPYREDENGVIPVPVSHSAFPSYALLYRGREKTVFYSGDLRVMGPLGGRLDTLRSIEEILGERGCDVALVEGTNIGSVETPITPDEFRSMLARILMESSLVVASIDPLDFELFVAVSEVTALSGRRLVVASPRLVSLLPHWLSAYPAAGSSLAVALELEGPPPQPAELVSLEQDVARDPGGYLLLQEPSNFLEALRRQRLWGSVFSDSIAVLTTPEPLEAESALEEEVLASWLCSLGVQIYRVRLSGHYYPHELGKIAKLVGPRKVVPIHTTRPSALARLFEKHMRGAEPSW